MATMKLAVGLFLIVLTASISSYSMSCSGAHSANFSRSLRTGDSFFETYPELNGRFEDKFGGMDFTGLQLQLVKHHGVEIIFGLEISANGAGAIEIYPPRLFGLNRLKMLVTPDLIDRTIANASDLVGSDIKPMLSGFGVNQLMGMYSKPIYYSIRFRPDTDIHVIETYLRVLASEFAR